MNEGKGISRAQLARQIGVGRSFVSKLKKGTGKPGVELMFRIAQYFEQPVDAIFQAVDDSEGKAAIFCANVIPDRQFNKTPFASASAKPMCNSPAGPPARPAGMERAKDKSLVSPTAKVVAPSVAQSSQMKKHETK